MATFPTIKSYQQFPTRKATGHGGRSHQIPIVIPIKLDKIPISNSHDVFQKAIPTINVRSRLHYPPSIPNSNSHKNAAVSGHSSQIPIIIPIKLDTIPNSKSHNQILPSISGNGRSPHQPAWYSIDHGAPLQVIFQMFVKRRHKK